MSIMRGDLAQVLQAFRDGWHIVACVREVHEREGVFHLKPPYWVMQHPTSALSRELLIPENWKCPGDI